MLRANLARARPLYLALLRKNADTDWNDWQGFAEFLVDSVLPKDF
jgi:hypothetical protein